MTDAESFTDDELRQLLSSVIRAIHVGTPLSETEISARVDMAIERRNRRRERRDNV